MSTGHILVVDDEPSMLRYLQTVLELDSRIAYRPLPTASKRSRRSSATVRTWCCWTW
jgi:CheY-like chemotaxis protein